MTLEGWVLATQAATLVSVVAFGLRIVRFVNRIEFRVELMWQDYERRIAHVHWRVDDVKDAGQ